MPSSSRILQGDSAAWFLPASDTDAHTISDGTGMGLFDSGLEGPGDSFIFAFTAAGRYRVVDTVSSSTALLNVPIQARPPAGGLNTAEDQGAWSLHEELHAAHAQSEPT